MKRLAVLAACLAALVFGLLALAEGETVIKGGSGLSAPSASFAPSAGQTIPVHLVGAQANEQEATEEFPFSLYASGDAATSVALDFSAFADGDVLIQYSSQGDPNASGWKVADLSDGGKAVCLPPESAASSSRKAKKRMAGCFGAACSNPKAKQMRRERSRLSWREKRP